MAQLIDSLATERTRALHEMMASLQGRRIILGQQEAPRTGSVCREIEWIEAVSGEEPALLGLDFIHEDYEGVAERALRWNERSGIVTICHHTGVAGGGYPDSRDETPDWEKLFTDGTNERGLLLARWEREARALDRLQREDVPVLWRPYHEFDGGWFWWGKGGGEAFIRLWREMVARFTREYGLHNLIWVLGYADDVREGWYPGDEYCDIAGSDTYRSETAHSSSYRRLKALVPDKLLCFHECGKLPPVERFFAEGCPWSYVMPWHSRFMFDNGPARIRQVYTDERSVTLRRLPKF